MDADIKKALAGAELTEQTMDRLPRIAMSLDERGEVIPVGDEIRVTIAGEEPVPIVLRKVAELFEGNRVPPDFSRGPTPEYAAFFMLIERTAVDYCRARRKQETDHEFEQLYSRLRKWPDGRDVNPIFSYLRAAARLYMSLAPVSKAEFEAVADRLRRSAKTFAMGQASRNYIAVVQDHVP